MLLPLGREDAFLFWLADRKKSHRHCHPDSGGAVRIDIGHIFSIRDVPASEFQLKNSWECGERIILPQADFLN